MTTIVKNSGSSNLEAIREMLLGNKSIDQAVNEMRGIPKAENIGHPDTPTAWLYTRYDEGHPTCVKIAWASALTGVHAALQLFVRANKKGGAKWYVEPFLIRAEFLQEEKRYAVDLTDQWIELLLKYVEGVFDKLKAVSGLNSEDEQKRLQEQRFEVRVRRFQRYGPKSFFLKDGVRDDAIAKRPDPAVCVRWEIASRWDDWNRAKVGMEKRLPEIKRLRFLLTESYFKKLCITILKLPYKRPEARSGKAKRQRAA